MQFQRDPNDEMRIDRLIDNLEPHYQNLDHIVDYLIRPVVSERKFKYLDACRFKIKAIWYVKNRIENLDTQYKELLSLCISKNALNKLSLSKNEDLGEGYYCYVPFYEAVEFENLLSQGKACLDCFSKAIGSVYGESPNNVDKLLKVLKSKPRDPRIDKLLSFIQKSYRLQGVIIDPKIHKKKSIRDLIAHRERIDIFFTIRTDPESGKYTLSDGALLNMRHSSICRVPNYLVKRIANKVWFVLSGIIKNCFEVLFDGTNTTPSSN